MLLPNDKFCRSFQSFVVITLNQKSYDEKLITAHCAYLNNKGTLKVHYQYTYYTQTSRPCAIY